MHYEGERLYLVTYDIRDDARWRRVYKIMQGYGQWLQLSVFQCVLSAKKHAEMIHLLDAAIAGTDHVLIFDLGATTQLKPKIVSLGQSYEPVQRGPIVV
jgi:CRISPR-associated protein Cas2